MRATSDALTEWWRLNMIKHARQSLERGAVVVANRNNSSRYQSAEANAILRERAYRATNRADRKSKR